MGTLELLEQHFDTVFAAPDGIKKLRELILTLAMQGKLVPQDPNDPPSIQLLQEIETAKRQLLKEGKIKPIKPLQELQPKEIPYSIPDTWKWVRLGLIGSFERGKSKHRPRNDKRLFENGIYPLVQTGDVAKAKKTNNRIKTCGSYYNELGLKQSKLWGKGTLCITIAANIAETGFLDMDACIPDSVVAFVSVHKSTSKLVKYFIDVAKDSLERFAPSTAQKNINLEIINELAFPLPPLPEQHRIVGKIDELMARCDELEKLRDEREQRRLAVHTAAIKQILDTQETDGFSNAWHFIIQKFGELYSVKENVSELRKTILQLAVMGKLLPQNPDDPPANQLLDEIEAEKKHLVKEGKIKAPKPLPAIKPEETPYTLPNGWKWVRLGELSLTSDSGWSPQCYPAARTDSDWGVLKVSAVSWGVFNPNENKALPADKMPKAECEVKPGDFLISRANTDELVARSVVVQETPPNLMMSDKIVRFRLSQYVNKSFINIANGSNFSRVYYICNASGTSSSMKNVSREVMMNLPLPLPPIQEQNRIVAKIDQLMALCDTLEQKINAVVNNQTELLKAFMAQV